METHRLSQKTGVFAHVTTTDPLQWRPAMKAEATQEKQAVRKLLPFKAPDVLDVAMTAQFLDVSMDTVYTLLKEGYCLSARSGVNGKPPKPACCAGWKAPPRMTPWRVR